MDTPAVSIGSVGIVRTEKGKKGVGILDGGCFYAVALLGSVSLALLILALF